MFRDRIDLFVHRAGALAVGLITLGALVALSAPAFAWECYTDDHCVANANGFSCVTAYCHLTRTDGVCVYEPNDGLCDDYDVCTWDWCDVNTGQCMHEFDASLDESCAPTPPVAICRTPGFWATHGDGARARNGSSSVTGAVIAAAGGSLDVCGQTITSASFGSAHGALEAMCVRIQGNSVLQLARQLTATALNCAISGDEGCETVMPMFAGCSAECSLGLSADSAMVQECISALDCFNNGGMFDSGDGSCDHGEWSCHDAPLCPSEELCFEPPGPATSPKTCNMAKKSSCTIFGCPE